MGRPDLDHRTDIYSLGCILFHMLCGRPPFISDQGTGMMIAAHMRDAPPDPRTLNPHVPSALAAIVLRCLEKEPAARFQTANELQQRARRRGRARRRCRARRWRRPIRTPRRWRPATRRARRRSGPRRRRTRGPTGGALTTNSGSAAQMVAMTEHKKSGKGVALGVGAVVLAVGGIGVGVALNSGDDKPAQVASARPREGRRMCGRRSAKPEAASPSCSRSRSPWPSKPEAAKPEAGKPAEARD